MLCVHIQQHEGGYIVHHHVTGTRTDTHVAATPETLATLLKRLCKLANEREAAKQTLKK